MTQQINHAKRGHAFFAAIAVAASAVLVGAGAVKAHVPHQGNWTPGCADGWICFWHGDVGASEAVASSVHDSSFVGDTYGSGHQLGDHVKWVQNRFVGSTHIAIYRDPGFLNFMGCAHANDGHLEIVSGGNHVGNGVSSFQGLSC